MPKVSAMDRPKRPDSAALARPKVKFITHGGASALLRDSFDGRTRLARLYHERLLELQAHLGGDLSAPQKQIVDQAVRLGLAADIAWGAVLKDGVVNGSATTAAFETYVKATRDQRAALQLLGLERRSKPVQDIDDYLRAP